MATEDQPEPFSIRENSAVARQYLDDHRELWLRSRQTSYGEPSDSEWRTAYDVAESTLSRIGLTAEAEGEVYYQVLVELTEAISFYQHLRRRGLHVVPRGE